MVTIDDAVEVIGSPAGRIKEARDEIAFTVGSLKDLKRFFNDLPSAGKHRRQLNKYIDALRKAEATLVTRHLEVMQSYAAALNVRLGAKRRDPVKSNAVTLAAELLRSFGKEPTGHRGGAWRKLSNTLYTLATREEADLYEYLREHMRNSKLDPLSRDVAPIFDFRP
jgi:hypothetical protein